MFCFCYKISDGKFIPQSKWYYYLVVYKKGLKNYLISKSWDGIIVKNTLRSDSSFLENRKEYQHTHYYSQNHFTGIYKYHGFQITDHTEIFYGRLKPIFENHYSLDAKPLSHRYWLYQYQLRVLTAYRPLLYLRPHMRPKRHSHP